jgi:hypothetical protein
VRLLAPRQTPTWRTRVSLFVWVFTLDLSGMGGPTSSIRYCPHSYWDHVTTQAPPLRQSRDTFGGSIWIYFINFSNFHFSTPKLNFFSLSRELRCVTIRNIKHDKEQRVLDKDAAKLFPFEDGGSTLLRNVLTNCTTMKEARRQKTIVWSTYSIYIMNLYPNKQKEQCRIIPELTEMEYEKCNWISSLRVTF